MDDIISRQAAIDNLERYRELFSWDDGDRERAILSRVIKELQSMPTADLSEYCDKLWKIAYEHGKRDAQPATEPMTGLYVVGFNDGYEAGKEDAQPKKGKWIKGIDVQNRKPYFHLADALYCSVCHEEAYRDTDYGQQLFAYCPNCGARMEE